MSNALTERLQIELPIIQAPMAGVQDSALCIAVSNAGGLGSLPGAMLSPAVLHAELEKITSATERPYNVNFFCHVPPEPDSEVEDRWRQALAPYYEELALDPAAPHNGASRAPFSQTVCELLARFRPPVVSFHFGLPQADLLDQAKAWGAFVISSATTVAEARWLADHGADAIIAQGLEAGGHRGHFLSQNLNAQMGTLALVPQIVSAVDLPVIAAGGIADARGVQAALDLGASAAQIGTAYLLCPECNTSRLHRTALQDPEAGPTALTNLFSGRPARGLMNRLMREQGPMSELPPPFPLAAGALAPLRSKAEASGRDDFSPLWCGQNRSGCQELPAAELTRQLAGVVD